MMTVIFEGLYKRITSSDDCFIHKWLILILKAEYMQDEPNKSIAQI